MSVSLPFDVEPGFDIATFTDQGDRTSNQDRVSYSTNKRGLIMVIADGLGGHEGGELAAETFSNSIIDGYDALRGGHIDDPNAFLVSQIIQAHRNIIHQALANGFDSYSPKTTGVICLIQHGYGYIAHVGDSRLYHYRGGRVVARTEDHTESEQKRRDGLITEDEMRLAKHQTPLTRCIGGRRRSLVTLSGEFALDRGDLLVMCTDGIWRAFDARSMYRTLSQSGLESGLEDLTKRAKKQFRNHCDNATTLAMRWESEKPSQLGLNPPVYDEAAQAELWRKIRLGQVEKLITETPREKKVQLPADVTADNAVPNAKNGVATKRLADEIAEVDQAIAEIEHFVDSLDDVV